MAYREVQPVPAARLRPRAAWSLAAAALTGAVVALAMPQALVGVFYDDGIYAALARSLAEGGGYRLPYLPGTPPAVHYPFLYPAFLAALWKLWPAFPDNVALLRGVNALLMAVFAGLGTAYLSRGAGRPWIVAAAIALAATSVPLVAVATVLFSEPLFLALAVPACWAADVARGRDGRAGLALAVAAGVFAGLAALTRSIGITVVVGVAASLFVARRRLAAAAAAGTAAILLAPWMLWTAAHRGAVDPVLAANYGTYGALLAQGGASWLSPVSLLEFARPLAAVGLPGAPTWLVPLLALPALVAMAVGMRALLARAPAAAWMLLAYLAIVAVWPYAPDRFVWAALPWLACAFALGVAELLARQPGATRWRRVAGWAAAAVVAAGFLPRQAVGLPRGDATATQRGISATFEELLPWIRGATDSSAVIAGEDEALIWLYTGRRAVPSYLWRVRGRASESFGPDTLRAFLLRSGATHLVLTGPGSEAAQTINDLIGQHPGFLRVVRSWPRPMLAFEVQRR